MIIKGLVLFPFYIPFSLAEYSVNKVVYLKKN